MLCTPVEVKAKSEAFLAKWKVCKTSPNVDGLVEFAVAASSVAQFFSDNGMPGLHQGATAVEQRVLALLEQWGGADVAETGVKEINNLLKDLAGRINTLLRSQVESGAERRANEDGETTVDLVPTKNIWLITTTPQSWGELVTQAGYFNIQVEVTGPQQERAGTQEPTIVLVDAQGLGSTGFIVRVQALRARFTGASIIGLRLDADFDGIKLALRAGCDFCFQVGTTHSVVMNRIVKQCGAQTDDPYRVLILDNSSLAGGVMRRTLKESGIESMAITQAQELLSAMAQFRPDLVLMEMNLPGCTGIEATRVMRINEDFQAVPIVYLSSDNSVGLQLDALRVGGDHFLPKPFNPLLLNAVVKSKIARYRRLRRFATMDSLTGVLNHTASQQSLDAAIVASQEGNFPLSIALIDIDDFKRVNEAHGHATGDQVLRSVAWLLKRRLRKTDVIGRFGGEEFVVILPHANAQRAADLMDRIRADFAKFSHPSQNGSFACSFSCGIAQWTTGGSATSLLRQVDDTLQQAKQRGRNQVASD